MRYAGDPRGIDHGPDRLRRGLPSRSAPALSAYHTLNLPQRAGDGRRKIDVAPLWMALGFQKLVPLGEKSLGKPSHTPMPDVMGAVAADNTAKKAGRAGTRVQITVAKFANCRNSHCVTMASLEHAKLANSLIWEASHSSLGSANEIKVLFQNSQLVSNNCPINVCGQTWTSTIENRAHARMPPA
jgi:hypothetical protein